MCNVKIVRPAIAIATVRRRGRHLLLLLLLLHGVPTRAGGMLMRRGKNTSRNDRRKKCNYREKVARSRREAKKINAKYAPKDSLRVGKMEYLEADVRNSNV